MQDIQSTFPVGTIIRRQYAVVDLLGKGAFGAVYLVRDERNHQNRFVLKEVMHAVHKERHRFPFDAAMLRRLKHLALPRIYQVFHSDKHDRSYILMDYIEGRNLETVQQGLPQKCVSLPEAMTLMSPIMDAVSYLQRQHPPLIHGDIKPFNIIETEAGIASVLVDFGGAKGLGLDTIIATSHQSWLSYRAPEQYTKGASPRTDIYALGAIFYMLLTGAFPAAAPDRLARPGQGEPDPLWPVNQIAPSVPTSVAEAIHYALSINSYDRFSTVDQFWEALWQVIHTNPTVKQEPELTIVLPAEENVEMDANPTVPQITEPVVAVPGMGIPTLIANPTIEREPISVGTSSDPPPTPALPEEGKPSVRVPLQDRSPLHRSKKPGLPLLLFLYLALLVSIGLGSGLWLYITGYHLPSTAIPASTGKFQATSPAKVTATAVPVSKPYPNVVRPYTGTIYNIPDNLTTKMSLTGMRQSQGSISGYFTGLHVNGSFRGTINASSHIEFTVRDPVAYITVYFDGAMQSDGNLSGNFCNLNREGQCAGEYGLWSVAPVE